MYKVTYFPINKISYYFRVSNIKNTLAIYNLYDGFILEQISAEEKDDNM